MERVEPLDCSGFDLIGDVHGCADALAELLERLGYVKHRGTFRHGKRKVIFIGDIVDRGPKIREALHLVHDMIESDQAVMVMGNHEYNALTYSTETHPGSGRYLREHSARNTSLLQQTLEQFAHHPRDWRDFIKWFKTLPLFLDWPSLRAVHACWDHSLIQTFIQEHQTDRLNDELLPLSVDQDHFIHKMVDRTLRGTTMPLPDGEIMIDGNGISRRVFRTKFWEKSPKYYNDVVFQPDCLPGHIGARELTRQQLSELLHYPGTEKLLFIGHYWRRGAPEPITANIACLDYSAVRNGHLVAYRIDDELQLMREKFIKVDAKEHLQGDDEKSHFIDLTLAMTLVGQS